MTTSFILKAKGADAGEAFLASSYKDMAAYPPSSMGQKHSFIQFVPSEGEEPLKAASRLITTEGSPVYGVAAPAGCIQIAEGDFLFFGWANLTDRKEQRYPHRFSGQLAAA